MDDWRSWGLSNGIISPILSYINWRPGNLFDSDMAHRTGACPRTWHMLSKVWQQTPPSLRYQVAAGCIGSGPAAEFVAFTDTYDKLPDVKAILAKPAKAKVPAAKDTSVLWALCGALVEAIRDADEATQNALCIYVARMPDEYAVKLMCDAVRIQRGITQTTAGKAWISSHANLVLPTE